MSESTNDQKNFSCTVAVNLGKLYSKEVEKVLSFACEKLVKVQELILLCSNKILLHKTIATSTGMQWLPKFS